MIILIESLADTHIIRIGPRFAVSFQRTLRVPDTGRTYPLPPGLGAFPIYAAAPYGDVFPGNAAGPASTGRAPIGGASNDRAGNVFFIPMYQREALWLGFRGASWHPNAVMIFAGGVNAISGAISGAISAVAPGRSAASASGEDDLQGGHVLDDHPQNYIVTPLQPWLDGFNTGDGTVRQFVAMPLGLGYTMEAAITDRERYGRIHITVFEPKHGRFPDEPPPEISPEKRPLAGMGGGQFARMGLGAGGVMRQKIYPDPHGLDAWDPANYGEVTIHIVNSAQFREITGQDPPPTPVDAAVYTLHGLPWFELFDADKGDVPRAAPLAEAKTVRERDLERGIAEETAAFEVSGEQVKRLDDRDNDPGQLRDRRKKQEP